LVESSNLQRVDGVEREVKGRKVFTVWSQRWDGE
jgi:hypothetical protein